MSRFPAPDRERHDDFCATEHWEIVHGSTGKPVQHHRTYELLIANGEILRTRISKPVDRTTYSPSMWSVILRDQLKVALEVFWACVNDKILPDRGLSSPISHRNALPLHIINELVNRIGMSPESAITLTLDDALERITKYWKDNAAHD